MPRKTPTSFAPRAVPICFNEAAARCRGKRGCPCATKPGSPGFNEAAARCRGKHRHGETAHVPPARASMRPRPDAAENILCLLDGTAGGDASMRPRPDAAENGPDRRKRRRMLVASMRPRPDAAENQQAEVQRLELGVLQ